MTGMFTGINTALRGLEVQQTAMNVTAHNIANVSTPGYSRQDVDIQTTDPISDPTLLPAGAGQMGTGATVEQIRRSHDDFVQQQTLYQNGVLSQRTSDSNTLNAVSSLFNEPGPQGFSTQLSAFFTSWQTLASNPSDMPTRAAVVASGQALAAGFNTIGSSLHELQVNEDGKVVPLVQEMNTITSQLATINGQINAVSSLGEQPNDLLDKRDNLLNRLSQIADVNVYIQPSGVANVVLQGAGGIVQGTSSFALTTLPDPARPGMTGIALASAPTRPITPQGGELGGALTARDSLIQSRITSLNQLATNVMGALNTMQANGKDMAGNAGIPFFVDAASGSTSSTTALSITVNPALVADPSKLAAASIAGAPGDGSNAQAIAGLQSTPATGQTTTLQAQYNTMISTLGVDTKKAQDDVQANTLVLQNLSAQQATVSGVSTDEEASKLIEYQNAYAAAARVISIFDQTISDMIKQLGG